MQRTLLTPQLRILSMRLLVIITILYSSFPLNNQINILEENMSFDYVKFKPYTVNYMNLVSYLNQFNIFSDKNMQRAYLLSWVQLLKSDEEAINRDLKDPEKLKQILLTPNTEPETFQYPVSYGGETIQFHFRISAANKLLSNYNHLGTPIPTSEFEDPKSNTLWTPVDKNTLLNHEIKILKRISDADPILMVPFSNGQYDYLVIDGNHRITYSIQNKITELKNLVISEESVIEHQLMFSSFDIHMYILHNEINHLGKLTLKGDLSPLEISRKSFLVDGVFKFRSSH